MNPFRLTEQQLAGLIASDNAVFSASETPDLNEFFRCLDAAVSELKRVRESVVQDATAPKEAN